MLWCVVAFGICVRYDFDKAWLTAFGRSASIQVGVEPPGRGSGRACCRCSRPIGRRCRSGVGGRGLCRPIALQKDLPNLLAQFGGDLEELLDGNGRDLAAGQFVLDIFLEAQQPVQIVLTRGGDFFEQEFPSGVAEGIDVVGEMAAPLDEGAFGDVEFGSDVAEASALGAEFNELFLFFFNIHRRRC